MLDSLVTYIKHNEFIQGDQVMRLGHDTEAALYFLKKGTIHVKSSTTDETMEEVGMENVTNQDLFSTKPGSRFFPLRSTKPGSILF